MKSELYWELLERRIARKITPYVFGLLCAWTLVISLEVWKISEFASNVVYYLY